MLGAIDFGRLALLLVVPIALAIDSRAALRSGSWRTAPMELFAFLAFSILVVVLDFGTGAFAPEWHAETLRYTGWAASMPYLFGAIIAWALCAKRTSRSRIILLVYLAGIAVVQALEFWAQRGRVDDENPFLRVSPYRPVWTVLIPLLWMAVLLSPRVKRFCTSTTVAVAT